MSTRVQPIALSICLLGLSPALARETENLVLVTLDGARGEEIFGGLDIEVLRASKEGKAEDTDVYRRYWAPTAEERRRKLLPFLWGELLVRHGSIAGNRALGSRVALENSLRFSYPGYSEILTGKARDDLITENAKRNNPHTTVLETLKKRLGLDQRGVAAFASWDVLGHIVEHERGAITTNAGFEEYPTSDPGVAELNRLQRETVTPWDTVRHDIYTFRFAAAHLEAHEPRVLYIGLGETDDWAHDGRYDRVLGALERTDTYLRQLWEILQTRERYRGKTGLIVTTDHGRGDSPKSWRDHGKDVEGAQWTWIVFAGPDWEPRGEWRDAEPLTASQIAATMCAAVGVDWSGDHPDAAKPVKALEKRRPE
jgi:hypothetical protein